ncbi:M REDUCTASE II SUBUNIT GAMMA putative (DUF3741)-RELATED [Salix viminalis]|uniref:M REDUCTASE II SUBUNIT GAMMA putative (DUF3741)-RELATED n=1 Tax=Salix viminalis TaxID=40686 RepID=A0A9Q0SES6_SALVM|nr:M REDUCTASE II SUBUNIT GAMMA putative (DUF3741)-RELATED [Salix viminalis]
MSFVNSCAHPIFSSHHRIFICLLWMVWLDSSLLDTPLEQLEFISFTGSSISSSESDVAGMFFGDKTGDKMYSVLICRFLLQLHEEATLEVIQGAEEDEKDWFFLVRTPLAIRFIFSPESPLHPSLRGRYVSLNDKELLFEAKRRQRRSNRKLVFASVNAALVEITGHGSDRSTKAETCSGVQNCLVVGKGWVDKKMRGELDSLGNEIEGKLLDELVEEAVLDLTGRL